MKRALWSLGGGVAALLLALPLVRFTWEVRSSNPVRRGLELAESQGCFSCHGPYGSGGPTDPGLDVDVPGWGGGVWMMYVDTPDEVREYILDGVSQARAASVSAREERARAEITMPAYRDRLSDREIDDLVAAFSVLSAMVGPSAGSAAGRGRALARKLGCESCHGPGGSGGRANPGSFTGFVPGWYGAAFEDLVRSRAEHDTWLTTGSLPRIAEHPLGGWFLDRQLLDMPAYPDLEDSELDDLWAYVVWLGETHGGLPP